MPEPFADRDIIARYHPARVVLPWVMCLVVLLLVTPYVLDKLTDPNAGTSVLEKVKLYLAVLGAWLITGIWTLMLIMMRLYSGAAIAIRGDRLFMIAPLLCQVRIEDISYVYKRDSGAILAPISIYFVRKRRHSTGMSTYFCRERPDEILAQLAARGIPVRADRRAPAPPDDAGGRAR